MNVAASLRTQGYLDYFPKSKIHSTLITTNWERNGDKWKEHNEDDILRIEKKDLIIYKIPNNSSKKSLKLKSWEEKGGFINKARTALYYYGNKQFDFSPKLIAQHEKYQAFLKEHLEEYKYSFALVIFSPSFHLNLIDVIHPHMPVLVDFRDLWSNQWMNINYKPGIRERIRDFLIRKHWRKQLKKVRTIITVSKDHANYLQKLANKDSIVVRNGFNVHDFKTITYERSKFFRVSYIGTLYPEQNIEMALAALNNLVEKIGNERIKISFLGIRLSSLEESIRFEKLIDKYALSHVAEIRYERTDRFQALTKMKNSEVLLFPTFFLSKGVYSTRIFENIGSNTCIVAFPNDNGIIQDLFSGIQYCFIQDSSEELANVLNDLYINWKNRKSIRRNTTVLEATREFQIEKLTTYIRRNILNARNNPQ